MKPTCNFNQNSEAVRIQAVRCSTTVVSSITIINYIKAEKAVIAGHNFFSCIPPNILCSRIRIS